MTHTYQGLILLLQNLKITPARTRENRAWNDALTTAMEKIHEELPPQVELPLSDGEKLAAHLVDQRLSAIQEAFRLLGWPPLKFELVEDES